MNTKQGTLYSLCMATNSWKFQGKFAFINNIQNVASSGPIHNKCTIINWTTQRRYIKVKSELLPFTLWRHWGGTKVHLQNVLTFLTQDRRQRSGSRPRLIYPSRRKSQYRTTTRFGRCHPRPRSIEKRKMLATVWTRTTALRLLDWDEYRASYRSFWLTSLKTSAYFMYHVSSSFFMRCIRI